MERERLTEVNPVETVRQAAALWGDKELCPKRLHRNIVKLSGKLSGALVRLTRKLPVNTPQMLLLNSPEIYRGALKPLWRETALRVPHTTGAGKEQCTREPEEKPSLLPRASRALY